jgi:hypothetical protein
MNGRFDPAALSQVAAPGKNRRRRKKSGFLHVNIGADEEKKLRALAECLGMTFRGFLRNAILQFEREECDSIAREHGVGGWEIDRIDRARRQAIGRARRALFETFKYCGACCAHKN